MYVVYCRNQKRQKAFSNHTFILTGYLNEARTLDFLRRYARRMYKPLFGRALLARRRHQHLNSLVQATRDEGHLGRFLLQHGDDLPPSLFLELLTLHTSRQRS